MLEDSIPPEGPNPTSDVSRPMLFRCELEQTLRSRRIALISLLTLKPTRWVTTIIVLKPSVRCTEWGFIWKINHLWSSDGKIHRNHFQRRSQRTMEALHFVYAVIRIGNPGCTHGRRVDIDHQCLGNVYHRCIMSRFGQQSFKFKEIQHTKKKPD